MADFRATSPEGEVIEYTATVPESAHLAAGWRIEEIVVGETLAGQINTDPQPVFGGRRDLTKLEFVQLLGEQAYAGILAMSRESVAVEAWVKLIELAAPEPGTAYSIDLDDQRMLPGLTAIAAGLEGAGVIPSATAWVEGIIRG